MNSLTENELNLKTCHGKPFLDFKQESCVENFPTQFSNYIKSHGCLYYWPQGGFHVVTQSEVAKTVLKSQNFSADRSRFFISRMPNLDLHLIKDFFGLVSKMMVMSDAKEHAKRRAAASRGLEDEVLDRFENQVVHTIDHLVNTTLAKEKFDFMSDIANKLPSIVLADLFCIPEEDREEFVIHSNIMTAFFGGAVSYENSDGIKVNQSACALKKYFKNLIEKRTKTPGNDFISHLIFASSKLDLDINEMVAQAVMMLVAGQVTTTDQHANNMFLLASHQEIQHDLRKNMDLIPSAIEEFKRFDPAVTFLFRVAKTDCLLRDQPIKAGDTIFISNHAVNRDLQLENPNHLNIRRKGASHFAYGHGPHYCLGAKLGRMQMRLLFNALLKNTKNLLLDKDSPAQRLHYSLAFSGFKELHLEVIR